MACTAAAVLGSAALPATAQEGSTSAPAPVTGAAVDEIRQDLAGDSLTIGLGVGVSPSYEGADEYRAIPGGALLGKYKGHDFILRGLQLYVDALPEQTSGPVDLSLGPVVGLRLNRTGEVKDPQVEALGELENAYEVGAFAAITTRGGLLNDFDSVSLRVTYMRDVGNAHESHVLTPAVEYGTPLSRRLYVRAYASADFVGDGYASYYFNVSPAGSQASGLRPYAAEGGFKSWSVGLVSAYSLSGRIKGPSLFAIGSYSRLQGDFARSPLVEGVGSAGQFFGAAGLAYTF